MATELEAGTEIVEVKNNPTTGRPWTQEEREEASRRAKELVAQGRFGGAVAGRRKKIPAYAVIAAEAQKHGRELAATLIDISQNGATEKLKMDAIKMLTDLELKAQANRREEEEHLLTLPRDELQRLVLRKLASITGEDYDIEIDDDDVEDEDERGDDELEAQA
jgi:hypothetical protein